jgi:hypothetical protein
MLGGLLLVGLLVAAFGVANVVRPELFAEPARTGVGLESDGGTPASNDRRLPKNRVLGACCVVFGVLVAAVAFVG